MKLRVRMKAPEASSVDSTLTAADKARERFFVGNDTEKESLGGVGEGEGEEGGWRGGEKTRKEGGKEPGRSLDYHAAHSIHIFSGCPGFKGPALAGDAPTSCLQPSPGVNWPSHLED